MNTKFKSYKSKLLLAGLVVLAPVGVDAKAAVEQATDTAGAEKEMVQVAYRKVAKKDILGGVSVVDVADLMKKNYNTYSLDNMQGYVGGFNGNSLWGMDSNNAGYLVMVDGVPRDATNVMPSEIDQITFLKGAQAVVLYGSKAAKGAVLITTKRGKNDGLKVEVRANTGLHVAKSFPEYLSSAEYMTLYNEARANDGLTPLYSAADIYNHGSGLNPYRYPNIDYYSSDYIRKMYSRHEATAEISGGGERAHFYSNINYYRSGDYFKFGEAKNNHISRFSVRGNVDMNISEDIKAWVNSSATFYDSNTAKGNYWNVAATMRPNFPQYANPLIPVDMVDPHAKAALELLSVAKLIDGKYFLAGSQANSSSLFGDVYAAGKSKWTSRQFQFDTGVNIGLGKLLTGLSFETRFAVDYSTSYTTSFDNSYAVYIPTWSNYNGKDVIVGLKKEGEDKRSGNQNISGSTDNQTMLFSAQFNYNNTFNNVHNLSAMLIASGYQQSRSGQYHKTSSANLALGASYNFMQKYYADLGLAVIHSAQLAPGHREALSPSLTLGWRLKNESFLKDVDAVDNMLLSVSGSIINEDIDLARGDVRYYLYKGFWTSDNGYGWYDGSNDKYTYYNTKATKVDENNVEAYQNRQGKAIDGIWGYKSAGFFQSEAEITASPDQSSLGSTVRPGDIKYVDVNHNGKIDNYDQVYLGKGGWYGAPFTMGVNFTAKWRGFTFFALGVGNFGAHGVKNSSYYWVREAGKYSAVVRNRWTPETAATATYPRLSTLSGSNNFVTSDFWLYKTDAFRLAKVQITYDLPRRLFGSTWVKGLSAFVSGANLLTISGEREVLELNVGSAPQTRYYNIGVKATF